VLGVDGLLEVVHKKITSCIHNAVTTGFESVVLIRSKPFKFYLPLTEVTSCIGVFVYTEEWDSEEIGETEFIDLTDSTLEAEYGADNLRRYTYGPYHQVMDLLPSSNLSTCLE
jgi:hypothetical protein